MVNNKQAKNVLNTTNVTRRQFMSVFNHNSQCSQWISDSFDSQWQFVSRKLDIMASSNNTLIIGIKLQRKKTKYPNDIVSLSFKHQQE